MILVLYSGGIFCLAYVSLLTWDYLRLRKLSETVWLNLGIVFGFKKKSKFKNERVEVL